MRSKVRANWDSMRRAVRQWPNSVRISVVQAVHEWRADSTDSKIFTFAWPSTSAGAKTTEPRKKQPANATKQSQEEVKKSAAHRCWTRLQRALFEEADGDERKASRSTNAASKMASKTAKAAQPVVHKVIMVGSGGVGKSALTLQFMYDEVIIACFSFLSLRPN